MTEVFKDSLELLPHSAAIMDASTLRALACNELCKALTGQAKDPRERELRQRWQEGAPGRPIFEYLGVDVDEMLENCRQHDYVATLADVEGEAVYLLFSLLPGGWEQARPDLIMVSRHVGQTKLSARLDHHKALSVILVNETIQTTVETLERSLVLIRGAMAAQKTIFTEGNRRAVEFFQMHSDTPSPTGA